MPIDITQFKAAMRGLAGHVCLITTRGADGTLAGLTATAVCSVSADPPTLLVCINRNSASLRAIQDAGVFGVNVLALESRHLADRFASPIPAHEKFILGDWAPAASGVPLLASALVGFDCRVTSAVDVGTHGILFGQIDDVRIRAERARPLLYAHGGYGEFYSTSANAAREQLWIPNWEPGEA